MIKANEIRVGNWLKDGETSNPCRLTEDNLESFFYNLKGGDYQPIPLTTEIFKASGFKIISRDSWEEVCKKSFIELCWVPGKENQYQLSITGKFTPCIIDYLHQLQNLYYSLTGEELKINL